jgi:hypothetical protein
MQAQLDRSQRLAPYGWFLIYKWHVWLIFFAGFVFGVAATSHIMLHVCRVQTGDLGSRSRKGCDPKRIENRSVTDHP